MSDLNNIEKLFQEQFENFEMPVRAELWSQVAAGAGIGKVVFWTNVKIITAAFVVVLVSASSWYLLKANNSTSEVTDVQPTIDNAVEKDVLNSQPSFEFSEENQTNGNSFVDVTSETLLSVEDYSEEITVPTHDLGNYLSNQDHTEIPISLTTIPDIGTTSSEVGNVQNNEPQHAIFEPAPTEKLNLEILIAPNKSEEKTLEQIHFPHAFVKIFNPNLPGDAGQFSIQSKDLGSFEIEIRTRSGKLVYTSTDPNFIWRGEQMDGSEAPEGTYLYTIFSTTLTGESIKPQAGSVFLMRK